ncbi:MerR family transcriptional regulator [Streptomyces albofaciens JCM 4342]|uniref:MerR family transcriptional regulator n=1 Tax=Streptomyces albofaciens TaxID=66866 RepID=UPI0012386849|nr:MerR family transcriptional regulator [Streptomyces albofaciens]KAA6220691.1 MerR family transcriptional regulator [Streptomyces albofaciens JCM 4342]
MFTIGDFAGHGRVSARMLRHYDAIGLLRPARTDPVTGYRYYEAGQLARLNRIIALKDLGFSLQQVAAVLDEQVSAAELRGMLRLRRAELAAAVTAAGARLARVEARLRTIEEEGRMAVEEVVVKRVEAVRVAELTGTAASFGPEDIGPVIRPLYAELFRRLTAAGVEPSGPAIAYYEDAPEGGDRITVHASVPVAAAPRPDHDFAIVDLPAVERAATVVHRGPMERVLPTAQTLARWLDDSPYRSAGYPRELTLECPEDRERWVTELQEPIVER